MSISSCVTFQTSLNNMNLSIYLVFGRKKKGVSVQLAVKDEVNIFLTLHLDVKHIFSGTKSLMFSAMTATDDSLESL